MVNSPEELRRLHLKELPGLASEIRQEILETVARQGGHLASNLGIVELTVALHYVFRMPENALLFDTGHQCYTHKLLTGRRAAFAHLREADGCCGFPSRSESPFDCFGTGHSGTAISAGLGLAVARNRIGKKEGKVVVVIGDGALGCGSSLEGLNNIAGTASNMVVVLNDNKMSIAPNVGAISHCLSRMISTRGYNRFKELCRSAILHLPLGERLRGWIRRFENSMKLLLLPAAFFEELGLRYIGPLDGHDVTGLVKVFRGVAHIKEPVLVHVITRKGQGYDPAMKNPTSFHSVSPFRLSDGESLKKSGLTFSKVLGQTLLDLRKTRSNIVAVTAGMEDGVGLHEFHKRYPDSFYDVGIAESHACAFCAGMAADGMRPVFPVYASFSQRAVDYVFHDVCLQRLPVIFCLDRAGAVADGPTHHGIHDMAFWRAMPHLQVLSPADAWELDQMLRLAMQQDSPVLIRYPSGNADPVVSHHEEDTMEWGKAQPLTDNDGKVVIWAVGREADTALKAAQLAKTPVDVVSVRFVMPFDEALMRRQIQAGKVIVTLEDHCVEGGFGSLVRDRMADLPDAHLVKMGWPQDMTNWGAVAQMRRLHGMDAEGIAAAIDRF